MRVGELCEKHDYYPGGRVTVEKSPGEYICLECEVEKLLGIISHLIILHDLGSAYEDDLGRYLNEIRTEYKHVQGGG